jgi:hypothetical protein
MMTRNQWKRESETSITISCFIRLTHLSVNFFRHRVKFRYIKPGSDHRYLGKSNSSPVRKDDGRDTRGSDDRRRRACPRAGPRACREIQSHKLVNLIIR